MGSVGFSIRTSAGKSPVAVLKAGETSFLSGALLRGLIWIGKAGVTRST